MEKSRAIELLEHLAWDRDIERNPYGDALNMAIEALKAQLPTRSADTISRQAAIDAFAKIAREKFNLSDEYNHYLAGLMDGELAIKGLPTIQPEPQWIPVSERLPETEEFVLASLTGKYRNTTFEHACEIADYADGEWCVYAYPHMSAEKCEELIEAWMPLPEPYKPNKKTKW